MAPAPPGATRRAERRWRALLSSRAYRTFEAEPPMANGVTIRKAEDADLDAIADNFRRMWLEIGWPPESLRADWREVVRAFVERARVMGTFAAFLAEMDSAVVGTAACQAYTGLYPEIRTPAAHLAGYVWGVYVEPVHRRRGVAARLTRAAIAHLEVAGCTRVRLHASPQGDPVYRSLGFRETNERELVLRGPAPAPAPPGAAGRR